VGGPQETRSVAKLDLYLAHLKTIRRDMLVEAQEKGANGSIGGKHRVPRFKGLRENENDAAPLLIRKKPREVGALADPAHFTVFKLKLDTTGLNAAEIAYLADDEN